MNSFQCYSCSHIASILFSPTFLCEILIQTHAVVIATLVTSFVCSYSILYVRRKGLYVVCRWRYRDVTHMAMSIKIPTFTMRTARALLIYFAGNFCFGLSCIIVQHVSHQSGVDNIIPDVNIFVMFEMAFIVATSYVSLKRLVNATVENAPILNPRYDPWTQLFVRQGCVDMDVLIGATSTKLDRTAIETARSDIQPHPRIIRIAQGQLDHNQVNTVKESFTHAENVRAQTLQDIFFRTQKLDAEKFELASSLILAFNIVFMFILCIITVLKDELERAEVLKLILPAVAITMYACVIGLGTLLCVLFIDSTRAVAKVAEKTLVAQEKMYNDKFGGPICDISLEHDETWRLGNFQHYVHTQDDVFVRAWPTNSVWEGYFNYLQN